ncbi:MAG: class I SAM-dependent methyltransferase [Hahellaceae bacterium]|nr:class I SAM-dependent methyltransferase [Hahellaceae bacterium]MCP5210350.1 class I SAM-dependent methyltransferase [Hahellaceae bacterium]
MTAQNQLYLDLSRYYDQFCSDIDYAEQSEFAQRAWQCFSNSGGRAFLDLACGTGQLLKLMEDKGFSISGLDNSQEMLDQTAKRCPDATLLLSDLAEFERHHEYDLITSFLYSMHYSHPLAAFQQTLCKAYQALKPGGAFVFDAVDKNGIANDTGVVSELALDAEHLTFRSRWFYSGQGDVLDLFLSITRESNHETQTWDDHHRMTAITIPNIKQLMQQAGFETTILERDYARLSEWDGKSSNVIMVGTKPLLEV